MPKRGSTHPALVARGIPCGERVQILPREVLVVVDELLRLGHADLGKNVPQLDDVGHRAALVVRVVGEVAVQRLIGFVEKFFVA